MNTNRRAERVIELSQRVLNLRRQLETAEAELNSFIEPTREASTSKAHAATAQRQVVHPKRPALPARRSPQPNLSKALIRVLRGEDRDFFIPEMMALASIDVSRRGSVYAALSRLVKDGRIAKGTKTGTYRAIKRGVMS